MPFVPPKVQRKFTVTEQELERSDDRCKDLERLVHVPLLFFLYQGQDNPFSFLHFQKNLREIIYLKLIKQCALLVLICSKLTDLTEQVSCLQAACKSAEARYEKASDAEETLHVRVQELTAEKEDVSMGCWALPTQLLGVFYV